MQFEYQLTNSYMKASINNNHYSNENRDLSYLLLDKFVIENWSICHSDYEFIIIYRIQFIDLNTEDDLSIDHNLYLRKKYQITQI